MQPLVIIGTGGSAYDALDVLDAINDGRPTWRVAGFLDDARDPGSSFLGFEVLGGIADAVNVTACRDLADAMFINVIGSERTYRQRPALVGRTGLAPERFATLVHPGAGVSRRAQLGRGVCVNYGVSVAAMVVVHDHVWLGPGAIIGHDSTVGAHSLFAPGAVASGFVTIGDGCYVGTGAHVRGRLTVGDKALIGMGAVVVKGVPPGAVVIGNPARPIDVDRPVS